MISIVSAADGESVRELLAAVTAASVLLAAVLALTGRGGRGLAALLAIGGLVLIAGLTLAPVGGLPGDGCATEPRAPLDDIPNVALFFVPALFAVVATRSPLLVLLAGPALSATIEWVQDVVPSLGRRCDVDDLLANSAGAVAAVAVGSLLLLIAHLVTRRGGGGRRRPGHPTDVRAARERELHGVR